METRAAKRRRLEEEEEEATKDRISNLPDAILHHILSSFDLKFIAQLGTLSKRWSHIWRSYPNVDFSEIKPSPNEAWEFVLDVFQQRQQHTTSNVKRFCLKGDVTPKWLNQCVRHVARHGVQELELNLKLPWDGSQLPDQLLLNNATLKVLTLHTKVKADEQRLTLQTMVKAHIKRLTSLTSLSLENVEFPLSFRFRIYKDDVFSSDRFPCLRSLYLKKCYGFRDMDIRCTSLEELQLYDLGLKSLHIFGTKIATISVHSCTVSYWVKISAPNVQNFTWYGNYFCESFLVERFLRPITFKVMFQNWRLNAEKMESLVNLLSAGACSEIFHIYGATIKLLSAVESAGNILPTYINIKGLTIRLNLLKEYILGIVYVLKYTPLVQTLTIIIDHSYTNADNIWNRPWLNNASISEEEYWESQAGVLKPVLSHLKTVRIQAIGGVQQNMVNLVKFLLKYGVALRSMKLICPNNSLVTPTWKQKIGSQMEGFPKASSNVNISFVRLHRWRRAV